MDLPRLDLSKLPHPSWIDSALLFAPGFVFELLVVAGNPSYISTAQKLFPVSSGFALYLHILIAAFLAFLFGGIAVIWVQVTRSCMRLVYGRVRHMREWWLESATPKVGGGPKRMAAWRTALVSRLLQRDALESQQREAAMAAWCDVAARLLKGKYGIEPPKELRDQQKWGIWFGLLGWPGGPELRGSSLVRAFHAIGWAGLAAIHFAPVLETRLFVVVCGFLILQGLSQEWLMVLRASHPSYSVGTHILAILRQIPDKDEADEEVSEG